jgi:hypothetical protein
MRLDELTAQEQRVLCVLVKHMIRRDGLLTDEEISAMSTVAEEMGQDAWRAAFQPVAMLRTSSDEVLEMARGVERAAVRQRILFVLAEVAGADEVAIEEQSFLDDLAAAWQDA